MAFQAEINEPCLTDEFVEQLANKDTLLRLIVACSFSDYFRNFGHNFLLLHPVFEEHFVDFGSFLQTLAQETLCLVPFANINSDGDGITDADTAVHSTVSILKRRQPSIEGRFQLIQLKSINRVAIQTSVFKLHIQMVQQISNGLAQTAYVIIGEDWFFELIARALMTLFGRAMCYFEMGLLPAPLFIHNITH